MRLLVGGYTKWISNEIVGGGEGIYSLDFNDSNGQLKLIDIYPALNPSYLAISEDENYLYAAEEIPIDDSPKIAAYKINPAGSITQLTKLSSQELPGSFVCHLALINGHLVAASYMSGNLLIYPINELGELLPNTQNIQHYGQGPNTSRQEAAHAHMIFPYRAGELLAVDLGLDIAKAYRFDESGSQLIESPAFDIQIRKGAGARHMAATTDGLYAFVFSELSAEVFSFRRSGDKFEPLEVLSSLSDDYKDEPSGAAIRLHPNERFLYVSNRGHNSITIYHFDKKSEKLKLISIQSTGGKTPRDFAIDSTGKWLLVGHQDSDHLVVFSINQEDGLLEKRHVNEDVKSASCLVFLSK